jgi:hypothetical protein
MKERDLDVMDFHTQYQAELARLRDKIDEVSETRQEDRIRRAEELSEVRVSIRTVEARLKALETGLERLMTHSTWLLRLLIGGFLAALLQFTVKGGLLSGF